jgi:hypothetical protein
VSDPSYIDERRGNFVVIDGGDDRENRPIINDERHGMIAENGENTNEGQIQNNHLPGIYDRCYATKDP